MGLSPVLLKKEDIKLPDYYKVVFRPIVGEPIEYEVAEHYYIKEVTKFNIVEARDHENKPIKDEKGQQVFKHIPVEFQTMRAMELKLHDRRRIVIPLEAGTLEFSKEFDEIIELKKLRGK